MLNHIVIMGRLTRDVDLRNTQSGVPVANFTLAVDRDYSSGEEKHTDFIDIVAWRHNAEFASKFFSKGRMAVVSGRLQISKFVDNDGNNRNKAEVVAENIYFGDSKKSADSNDSNRPYVGGGRKANDVEMQTFTPVDDQDGDLPF